MKASDVARTLIVTVSVFGVDGRVVEQGEALPNAFTLDYVFRAGVRNSTMRGSKIMVTVRDRPGNVTVREVVLK